VLAYLPESMAGVPEIDRTDSWSFIVQNPIRRVVRRLIRSAGFERRIAPSFVDVMKRHGIDVVLDVGANDGGFGREIRDAGYEGTIVSFEPNPEVFERLKAATRHDEKWDIFQLGVGDAADHLELSVTVNDVFSSFKKPSDYGRNWSGTVEGRTERVQVVRLDEFLLAHPQYLRNVYLKIDTQGFEMEVLRGAGDVLPKLAAVQAELGLLRIYAGQEDWLSLVIWMRGRGFEVATISCNSGDRGAAQVIELDVVFAKREV